MLSTTGSTAAAGLGISTSAAVSNGTAVITGTAISGSGTLDGRNDDDTLIGAEVLTDWYRRNILIYTKVINQIDFDSKGGLMIVMGNDHIPILAELFAGHPEFEVVPAERWLGPSTVQ